MSLRPSRLASLALLVASSLLLSSCLDDLGDLFEIIAFEDSDGTEGGLFCKFLLVHSLSARLSRNLSSPRRILALMVPRGCSSLAAISDWVSPSKKASSMAVC